MGCACTKPPVRADVKTKSVLCNDGDFQYLLFSKHYAEHISAGEGCRKGLAWSTPFTQQQTQFKIEEFWESRRKGSLNAWRTLRLALDTGSSQEAVMIATAAGLRLPQGLLSGCVDETGFQYDLPPYVLNPATEYGKPADLPVIPATTKGEAVEIKCRSPQFNDHQLQVSTQDSTLMVKMRLAEIYRLKPGQVRLFYNGRELKNEFMLLQYGVKDKATLTVVTLPRT
jgi:hypothetical protein